jgi:hypothetical protein
MLNIPAELSAIMDSKAQQRSGKKSAGTLRCFLL